MPWPKLIPWLKVIIAVLLAYDVAFGLYLVETYGWDLPKFGSVFVGLALLLFYLFTGKLWSRQWKQLQKRLPAFVGTPAPLLASGLILLAFGAVLTPKVFGERTLIITTSHDQEVSVSYKTNGKIEFIGYASKQAPLKTRVGYGTHTYVAELPPEFNSKIWTVIVERTGPVSTAQSVWFELDGKVEFDADNVTVDAATKPASGTKGRREDADVLEGAESLIGKVHGALSLRLGSTSPSLLEISDWHIKVTGSTKLEGWTFPYFGELPSAEASPITRGLALIGTKNGRYRVDEVETKPLGKGLPRCDYSFKVYCDPGYEYTLALDFAWDDLTKIRRRGRDSVDIKAKLQAPRRWDAVVGEQKLRILYNGRIDALRAHLDRLGLKGAYTIVVADSLAAKHFKDNGIKLGDDAVLAEEVDWMELKKLVGVREDGPKRPRSFVAVDKETVFVQQRVDGYRSDQIEPATAAALVAEYDRLWSKLSKSGAAK